jgi:hypothetical protein
LTPGQFVPRRQCDGLFLAVVSWRVAPLETAGVCMVITAPFI